MADTASSTERCSGFVIKKQWRLLLCLLAMALLLWASFYVRGRILANPHAVLEAAEARQWDRVIKLVEIRRSFANQMSVNGQTLLHMATLDKRNDVVLFLIRHGANMNACGKLRGDQIRAATALVMALSEGSDDIIRTLLENGADPNVGGQESYITLGAQESSTTHDPAELPALYYAFGNINMARLLLIHGADPNGIAANFEDYKSPTALLDLARKAGRPEIVKLLKEYGAKETITGQP